MKHTYGSVEVITGSMFCGKTDEMIRRLRRATIAKQKVQVFKPAIDDRYHETSVVSHAGSAFNAMAVGTIDEINQLLEPDTTVVAIDEAQFMEESIVELIVDLASRGMRVIVSGLDMDFRGEPFGAMPQIMAKAERVDKLHAICMVCQGLASHTQRLVNGEPAHYNDPVVIVGADEMYEARCRAHHTVPRD